MKIRLFLLFLFISGGALAASPAFALAGLVKSASSPAVYYLDDYGIRHPFPNNLTYKTWYRDYSNIKTLKSEEIRSYSLGRSMTVRPGSGLITFSTAKDVYAVEPGGVLRLFKNQELIEKIFGSAWRQRLITLPDSLFGDYSPGREIKEAYELPDGYVYELKRDQRYYFKRDGLLWPFRNWAAVLANNFKSSEVVFTDANLDSRKTSIFGRDSRVLNPGTAIATSTADCENKNLKLGFLLVGQNDFSPAELRKTNLLKERLARNFSLATLGLANADVSWPTTVLSKNPLLFFTDTKGQLRPDDEALNIFYDQNPDDFDFIILFNNFVLDEPEVARYFNVTNNFYGTGNSLRYIANLFSSRGKLKGVIDMGNINKYGAETEFSLNHSVNYIIHELGHHWSARASFFDDNGSLKTDLLTGENNEHWSNYLLEASPLGASGWQDNGDGTFTNKHYLYAADGFYRYSHLDLYFMGLLPSAVVESVKYVVPESDQAGSSVVKGKLQVVLMDKIIEAMGPWHCRLN
jgi:hypothetical protein